MATRKTKKSAGAGSPGAGAAAKRDHEAPGSSGGLVRLNKYLADNGIASRRRADQLIADGQVMIDGELVTEVGTKVDPTAQRVEVDGVVLRPEGERHNYYLLNKPAGVVCTNDPRETRPRAIDLIGDRKKGRIFPVGRLDEDTVGLILLTNDGDFANKLAHPRYRVTKTYRVQVDGWITDDELEELRAGVRLAGSRANFEDVRLQKRGDSSSSVTVVLREGKNREIRRVFAKLGLKVRKLRRTAIGPLQERGLKVGHWRPLLREEIDTLLEVSAQAAKSSRSRKTTKSAGRSGTGRSAAGRSATKGGAGRTAGRTAGGTTGADRGDGDRRRTTGARSSRTGAKADAGTGAKNRGGGARKTSGAPASERKTGGATRGRRSGTSNPGIVRKKRGR